MCIEQEDICSHYYVVLWCRTRSWSKSPNIYKFMLPYLCLWMVVW